MKTKPKIQLTEHLAPGASAKELIAVVHDLPGSPQDILLVGHEPDLPRLMRAGGAGTICGIANTFPAVVRALLRPDVTDLDERRILPARWVRPLDARVDRKECGPRHAVLQARPGSTAERARAPWQPLVERADSPTEREDLRPREVEPRPGQLIPPATAWTFNEPR